MEADKFDQLQRIRLDVEQMKAPEDVTFLYGLLTEIGIHHAFSQVDPTRGRPLTIAELPED